MFIGEKIRQDVELLYQSTNKYSEETGISRTTMRKIYSNGIIGNAPKTIKKIADTLGYKYDALRHGEVIIDETLREKIILPTVPLYNHIEEDLLSQFRNLSIKGQMKVIEYIEDIKDNYRKDK